MDDPQTLQMYKKHYQIKSMIKGTRCVLSAFHTNN